MQSSAQTVALELDHLLLRIRKYVAIPCDAKPCVPYQQLHITTATNNVDACCRNHAPLRILCVAEVGTGCSCMNKFSCAVNHLTVSRF